MPYHTNAELPDSVKNVLPDHAQDIYREAFNSAWDEYRDPDARRGDGSREEVSHRVAWSAVKHKYEKGDDRKWHPVGREAHATRRLQNITQQRRD